MSLLTKIFKTEPQKPTEEERTLQELREYIADLDAPWEVKYWLKKAVKEAKKGRHYDYQETLEKVDPRFVSEEYSTKTKVLLDVKRLGDGSYWLYEAERKAKEGDLEYRTALDAAQRSAGEGVIDDKIAKVEGVFEKHKWSKVPQQLEEKLREAVSAMASGEPQKQVDYYLDQAEKYAQVLGYSIRRNEETRKLQ